MRAVLLLGSEVGELCLGRPSALVTDGLLSWCPQIPHLWPSV